VDPRGSAPIYQRIAAELRARIESGELPPGAKLPTEQDLAGDHGVTRATARQAVQLLVNEGLVVSERPRGHFVRRIERRVYRPQEEWRRRPAYPELHQVRDEGGHRSSRIVAVELAEAPGEVAARLDLHDGDTVVVRRRVRFLEGVPVGTEDSYFPLDLVGDSAILHPAETGREANDVLTELGVEQAHAVDEIEVRMPTPDEASRLAIALGVPVAVHRVTGYTADDRPVRVVRTVLPGDRHVIVFERARKRRRPTANRR
jgi:DNA-binding GntR family transcriptional regulator